MTESADRGVDRTAGALGVSATDRLIDTSLELASLEAAVRLQWLRTIAELDARGAWRADGQTGLVPWLRLHHGLRTRTAREVATVVSRIRELPAIADAFGAGALSWGQAVAACQLATADTDRHWAAEAADHSAEDLRRMVAYQQARRHHRGGEADRQELRLGSRLPDGPNVVGRLAPDQLEALRVTLDRLRDQIVVADPDTGRLPAVPVQRAAALVYLAHRALAADGDPERATVVAHVDGGLLTGETDGHAALTDGTPLLAETVLRLACDGRIEWAVDGPDGTTLGIGRASRVWPPWLVRAIRARDGDRCRFPGCERPIHHIHHLDPWRSGGGTDSANGVGLCWAHHHLCHEGRWTTTGSGNGLVTFTGPTGHALTARPRHLTPKTKRWLARTQPHIFPPLE